MKKALIMMLAIAATLIISCSKDAKINRRIDGEWQITSIGGVPMGTGESYVFKFNKDKKLTGDGIINFFILNGGTEIGWSNDNIPFTYSISEKNITIIYNGQANIFNVSKYEKDKLELIDVNNLVWVLDPK